MSSALPHVVMLCCTFELNPFDEPNVFEGLNALREVNLIAFQVDLKAALERLHVESMEEVEFEA
jgi:hypothetical protein